MAIYETLLSQQESLAALYNSNLQTVLALQRTLIEEILPGLVDELGLNEEDEQRARQFLEDTTSIFRILKRHKFTVSFALESLRTALIWRLTALPVLESNIQPSFLRCFPVTIRDSFGRPIIFLKLAAISEIRGDLRLVFMNTMEVLRLHLQWLNTKLDLEDQALPVMQYVALIDVEGVSFQSVQYADLLTWYAHELLPRFPGMLAAAFILHYTWAHSGVWSLAKRVLPTSALSKIFFPSQSQLLEYFSPSLLPSDLGGSFLPLSQLDDPLCAHVLQPIDGLEFSRGSLRSTPLTSSSITASLSPTSSLNPFFGYPVSFHTSTPVLCHGRRRKRDLLYTLARLLWVRWKKHAITLLCLCLCLAMLKLRRYLRFHRWQRQWSLQPNLSALLTPAGHQ
ncbi:hypothetical protein AcV7_003816 [Taiwanofungus camphoratus]|nr:hypothetical protein AcV7_003816 [Antrodia cinnamomea]